jgi:hypothetical protein
MQKISKNGLMFCLEKARLLCVRFLLLFILFYNLANPAQSWAKYAPLAIGSPFFETSFDTGRVNAPSAYTDVAACPNTSCVYLPWLVSPVPAWVVEAKTEGNRNGTIWVWGDITTLYGYPIYNVTVKFRAYDAAGQLLGEGAGPTKFPATLPGQLNPFDFPTNINADSERGRLEYLIAGFDVYSPIIYAAATVITTTDVQMWGTTVYAQIRNDYSSPLTDVQAIAWAMQGYDLLYSVNHLEKVADILLPGETITYTKSLPNVGDPPYVRVAAQGILQP